MDQDWWKIVQKVCCYNESFMCWNNANINFKVAKVISWAWNYDGPWFYVPSILIEPYCSRNNSFILHLNIIKLAFWVAPRITKGIIVPASWLFDIWSSFFKLVMSHNAKRTMAEHFSLNLISRLWKKIIFLPSWMKSSIATWNWQRLQ